jgi:hypothetical protein
MIFLLSPVERTKLFNIQRECVLLATRQFGRLRPPYLAGLGWDVSFLSCNPPRLRLESCIDTVLRTYVVLCATDVAGHRPVFASHDRQKEVKETDLLNHIVSADLKGIESEVAEWTHLAHGREAFSSELHGVWTLPMAQNSNH